MTKRRKRSRRRGYRRTLHRLDVFVTKLGEAVCYEVFFWLAMLFIVIAPYLPERKPHGHRH